MTDQATEKKVAKAKPTLKKATGGVDEELMKKYSQMVRFLKNEISTLEIEMKKMKVILDQLVNFDPTNPQSLNGQTEIPGLKMQDLS